MKFFIFLWTSKLTWLWCSTLYCREGTDDDGRSIFLAVLCDNPLKGEEREDLQELERGEEGGR